MGSALPYFLARTNKSLFVEDNFTRECLLTLFPSCPNWLTIVVVGDSHAVEKMVRYWSHETANDKQVFGLTDLDFSSVSKGQWKDIDNKIYVMSCHEVENYLLNFKAIVNTLPREKIHLTESDIVNELKMRMRPLIWRWACSKTLATIHQSIGTDFPKQRQANHVCDEESAVKFICEHRWTQNIGNVVSSLMAEEKIRSYVKEFQAGFETDLNSEKWLQTFPGKEMFKCLTQFIFSNATSSHLLDYAKQICIWYRDNSQIPDELTSFMQTLQRL